MAKDTFWFTHDYNARNDDKILELRSEYGAEGYGIFWMIVESMANNEDGGVKASLIGGLSHGFGVAKDRLLIIVKFCVSVGLFYEENGFYFSKRMLLHKNERKLFSEAGSNGAIKRWNKQKENSPPIAPPMLMTIQNNTEHTNGNIDYNTKIWRKDCSQFLKDIIWKEKFCVANHLKMEDLEKSINEFIVRLNLQEDYKNVGGLKRHYTNHYNKHGLVVSEMEEKKKASQPKIKL